MASGMDEIRGIFLEVATGSLEELERLFLELDESSDSSAFKEVFRVAHNIKGSSKSVGMANRGRVTHELETLLIRLEEGSLSLSRDMKNGLLSAIGSLKELLAEAQATGEDRAKKNKKRKSEMRIKMGQGFDGGLLPKTARPKLML